MPVNKFWRGWKVLGSKGLIVSGADAPLMNSFSFVSTFITAAARHIWGPGWVMSKRPGFTPPAPPPADIGRRKKNIGFIPIQGSSLSNKIAVTKAKLAFSI